MKKQVCSSTCLILAFLFLLSAHVGVSALMCVPRGNLTGRKPPPGGCNGENQSQCCEEGRDYTTYRCSPPISTLTMATLTLNSFAAGGDGGGQSACDDKYHSDDELVVALSTGWFNHSGRCLKLINIYGNGRKVRAKVVDECDSTMGCDVAHDYQPPCDPDIVDASQGVWDALGVSGDNRGEMEIYWSDCDHASDLSINLLCVLGFMYLLYLFLD